MQPVEIWEVEEQGAPKGLEPAAGVARAVAQNRPARGIGDERLQLFERARAPPDALTRDQPDAGAVRRQRLEQRRNERRIILAVPVERDDDGRARMPYAC